MRLKSVKKRTVTNKDGFTGNKNGQTWIPDNYKLPQLRIIIACKISIEGHRRVDSTLKRLD